MKFDYQTKLFFIVVTIVFTFNFKGNIFSSAADPFFDYFQIDGESLAVGRLHLSEQRGLCDYAGFLGWTHPKPDTDNKYAYQYEAYQNQSDIAYYEGYFSQPGAQAFLFGLICKTTGWKGESALDILRWMVSFCTALAFTAFLVWVMANWGIQTTVFTFVCLLFSQWITVFGRNLFWVLSAFYIPFLTALYWLHRFESKSKRPLLYTFMLMSGTMFLKFLFTGFEYITTVMVMSVTPWVFYAIERGWSTKKFLRSAITAGAGVLSAVIAGIAWLAVQYSTLAGSLKEGILYIFWSFGKRAHGMPGETYDGIFRNSIDSNLWGILSAYLNDHAFHVAHWSDFPLWRSFSIVNFGFCILFFIGISYIAYTSKIIRQNPFFYKRQTALIAMLWVSLSAPLSWFVIFKGHSYIHTHMNPIVWYMPFMLLGFVLTGSTCWYILKETYRNRSESQEPPKTDAANGSGIIHSRRNLLVAIPACLMAIILMRLFMAEAVQVSGNSMENGIKPGDWILVNKLGYGGRTPRRIADIPFINILTWSEDFRSKDANRNWPYKRMKGYAGIRRNDIVIFDRPEQPVPLIKRVVGLPGETVELRAGSLWINGSPADTPPVVISGIRTDTLPGTPHWTLRDYGPLHLPLTGSKGYFVLGDNRDVSIDSRYFGYITEKDIIGKASLSIGSSGFTLH